MPSNEQPSKRKITQQLIDQGSRFEFVVPVKLDGRRYAVEVDQDATALNVHVASLRDKSAVFSAIAPIVALALLDLDDFKLVNDR